MLNDPWINVRGCWFVNLWPPSRGRPKTAGVGSEEGQQGHRVGYALRLARFYAVVPHVLLPVGYSQI